VTEFFHRFVENYGLIAVFIGCLAEGESAATLAGFFAHQNIFNLPIAVITVFTGAFLGDVLVYCLGRYAASWPWMQRQFQKPGFDKAMNFVRTNPIKSVLLNRYIYGLRFLGGVAVGMARIPLGLFMVLNAASAVVWTAIFFSIGYFLGAGAETALGTELMKHDRLLIGIVIGLIIAYAALVYSRRWRGKNIQ
jgi:membrane protein DedA with SNARE-associated domain